MAAALAVINAYSTDSFQKANRNASVTAFLCLSSSKNIMAFSSHKRRMKKWDALSRSRSALSRGGSFRLAKISCCRFARAPSLQDSTSSTTSSVVNALRDSLGVSVLVTKYKAYIQELGPMLCSFFCASSAAPFRLGHFPKT